MTLIVAMQMLLLVNHAFGHGWALLMPVVIWAVLLLFITSLLLTLRDGARQLRRLHQIPCSHCQYYTGSPYLKCPVHPMTALSEEAIHCRDYSQRSHVDRQKPAVSVDNKA